MPIPITLNAIRHQNVASRISGSVLGLSPKLKWLYHFTCAQAGDEEIMVKRKIKNEGNCFLILILGSCLGNDQHDSGALGVWGLAHPKPQAQIIFI